MWEPVDGGAAGVESDLAFLDGFEGFFFSGEGVVEFDGHALMMGKKVLRIVVITT